MDDPEVIIYLTNETQSDTHQDAVTGQPEYILVPRVPTKKMVDAAYDAALAEDAIEVWKAMISEFESSEDWKLTER
jgi:hypothetical protein